MPNQERMEFRVEGGTLIFRNFAGKENDMNTEGERNFCVILDEESAEKMAKDGWLVKRLRDDEEGQQGAPFIKVKVNYKNRPPRITLITSSGRTLLTEDQLEILDYTEFENVDLIATSYFWTMKNGKSGIAAYLKNMYVTIAEDDLDRKYASVPVSEG